MGVPLVALIDTAVRGYALPFAARAGAEMISNTTGLNAELLNIPAQIATQVLYAKTKNMLIDRRIYPNGDTMLIDAVKKGHKGHADTVNGLIQAGANLDLQNNNDGRTALIFAISTPSSFIQSKSMIRKVFKNIANRLIQAGANLNIQDYTGKTALMYAASSPEKKTVEALIQAGADITLIDHDGKTALMHAMEQRQFDRGHDDIMALLKKAEILNIQAKMFDILKSLIPDVPRADTRPTFLDLPMETKVLILSYGHYPESYKHRVERDLHMVSNKVNEMITNRLK